MYYADFKYNSLESLFYWESCDDARFQIPTNHGVRFELEAFTF